MTTPALFCPSLTPLILVCWQTTFLNRFESHRNQYKQLFVKYFYFREPRPRAMADEVPLIAVRTQTALQQTLLPFEPERFALLHLHRSLQIIYIIHRYDWNVAGVYSFLRARDQDMLSLCCYATRREHVERRTDENFSCHPQPHVAKFGVS